MSYNMPPGQPGYPPAGAALPAGGPGIPAGGFQGGPGMSMPRPGFGPPGGPMGAPPGGPARPPGSNLGVPGMANGVPPGGIRPTASGQLGGPPGSMMGPPQGGFAAPLHMPPGPALPPAGGSGAFSPSGPPPGPVQPLGRPVGMPGAPGQPPGAPMGPPGMHTGGGPPPPGQFLGAPPGMRPPGMPGPPGGPQQAPFGVGAPGMAPRQHSGSGAGMPMPPPIMNMPGGPQAPGGMMGPPPLGPPQFLPPGPGMGPPGMMMGPPGARPPPGVSGMPPPPGGAYVGPPGIGAPPGAYGAPPGGPPGVGQPGAGYDQYGQQRVVEQFESLSMGGPNPGQDGVDLNALPRPVGEMRDTALDPPPAYDSYNCHTDNMRMTTNAIPNSTALRARWPLPLGAVVHPMADEQRNRQVPVINLGSAGIIRCKRCRTYMNPFMTWTDGGRRFKCNVCALLNEIPAEYYCAMGNDGRRHDFNERPELCSGTVEYVAPAEYMVRPPMPPVYYFVIDVSLSAVQSGMLRVVSEAIKGTLDDLPGDERTLIGLLTYDSTLHFYNLKSTLSQPQMMVVADLEDPFLPLLTDDLLVNLRDSRNVVDTLLDSLPTTFSTTNISGSAMGPALQAAMMTMQHVGGKLQLFQAAVPNLGMGRIKNREVVNAYGTDREPALRQPEDSFFKRYAGEASRNQMTIDLYTFNLTYMDMASLACLPRFTCGDLYYYPGFTEARDGFKLTTELQHNLRRPTAWEAVMRIRCSKGLRISAFHGHFFNRSSDLLALPTCDPDKAFAVQIAHEESLVSGTVAYVQCALLYTNSNGERRIRVHTLSVPIVTELSELFKAADGPASAALLAKVTIDKSLNSRLDETRASVFNKVMQTIKEFRLIHGNAARVPNRMVFPEQLRCLPLWGLGLTKCTALRGGARDVNIDERIAVGHELMAANVEGMCRGVYPDLYPLHEANGDWGQPRQDGYIPLPLTIPLSGAYLEESGAYLMDNGRVFVLWLGRTLSRQWGQEVFGIDLASPEANDTARLQAEPERPNAPMSARVNAVLRSLRTGRSVFQQLFVVRQGSPAEMHIAQYFVEDRGPGMQSYPDWMIAIHKGVMAK